MTELSQKQTILIVDDESVNIGILSELLQPDYITLAATNGKKALQIATSDKPPDLILLDVVMQDMDGYEICARLKADSRTQKIPIIFITGKNTEKDEMKGFEVGAVDYVTKPFHPCIVKARVETHIKLKKYGDFLEGLSFRDDLTGIANRRRFDDYLNTTWNFAASESSPISLILMDIDHFKLFNDNYGHQAGDICLNHVGQKLSSSLRRKIDLVARYGGEEFACILPRTLPDGAKMVAEKLREGIFSLRIPHAFSSAGEYVTISLGAATIIPTNDSAPDVLVKAADEALYMSKESGRNKVSSVSLLDEMEMSGSYRYAPR